MEADAIPIGPAEDDMPPKPGKKNDKASKAEAKEPEIPVAKSPAQVAAEKAAQWKKGQIEAEEARKNKNWIKKKPQAAVG